MKTIVMGFAAGVAALAGQAASAQTTAAPAPDCAADPIYQQQDFTLGHWDVYNKGVKTAEVKMERVLGGCAIYEVWTPLGENKKGHGLGLFAYSRMNKQWGYFWVADNPANTVFTGSLIKPGEMRYVTERPLPTGGTRLRHWTLSLEPDGTVRELSVGTDDRKTWTTEYDLIWHKKK